MTVHIQWDNPEQTTLRYDFVDDWQLCEFEVAFRLSKLMTRAVCHQVDVILDFTVSNAHLPNAADYASTLLPRVPIQRGAIVLVGEQIETCNVFVRLQHLYKEAGKPLFLAGTLKQARAILPFTRYAPLPHPVESVYAHT